MLRFTIRELMLGTAIVATGAAWWSDHHLLCRRIVAMYHRGIQLEVEYADLTGRGIGDGGMRELPRGYILKVGFDLVMPFPSDENSSADSVD